MRAPADAPPSPERLLAFEELVTRTLAPLLRQRRAALAAARDAARGRGEALSAVEALAETPDGGACGLLVDVGAGYRVRAESGARSVAVGIGLGVFVDFPLPEAAALLRLQAAAAERAVAAAAAEERQIAADYESAASGLTALREIAARDAGER